MDSSNTALRRERSWAWSKGLACGLLAGGLAASAQASVPPAVPSAGLDAEQIVAKNLSARGGAEAWRKLTTMAWSGRVETASPTHPNLPFVLEQKRPNKTRFELEVDRQKSMRVFSGSQGWKVKPSASGRPEVVPYTPQELAYARDAAVIEGPLMDFSARGYALQLEATDEVAGHRAYRLRADMPSGLSQKVWVDAESFLELKLDRVSRDSSGRPFTVSVYFRDYKSFDGLQLPMTIETRAENREAVDKLVIERIALNPTLEDRLFTKPRLPGSRSSGVTVDTRAPPPGAGRPPAAP